MKQKGNESNNVQIGHGGEGNNYTLNQNNNKSFQDEAIPLLENKSFRRLIITNDAVTKRSLITIVPVILAIIALLADVLGIFVALGLNIDSVSFAIVCFFVCVILTVKNMDHINIFFNRGKIKRKDTRIGGSKIAHLNSAGSYSLYILTAKCVYLNCKGFIEVAESPPREQWFLAGKCTECGTDHSYKIDQNWIAYPADLDWSKNNNA